MQNVLHLENEDLLIQLDQLRASGSLLIRDIWVLSEMGLLKQHSWHLGLENCGY